MDGFPSGQRGQTVNLLAMLSKVRILPHPFGVSHIIYISSPLSNMVCEQNNIAGWSSLEARRALARSWFKSTPLLICSTRKYGREHFLLNEVYHANSSVGRAGTENPRVAGSIPALGTALKVGTLVSGRALDF